VPLSGPPASAEDVARLGELITRWAASEHEANELVLAVDSLADEAGGRRWFVRLKGEDKEVTTVWFHLRERTLHYESQFMPQPEENREELFELLLRLNARMQGMRFTIGWEDAVYLEGELPLSAVDDDVLDTVVGSAWTYTERWFRACMRIGYRSKFRG
jgi:hypothetical protein